MRNANPPHANLAAATAALAVQLTPDGQGLPEGVNIQLFPDGEFVARDGRPAGLKNAHTKKVIAATSWRMDAECAARLIAQVDARETPLFVDYEHHTLTAKEHGHKALAAGWIERLVYEPGRGLFASVAWTDAARAHIQADEYRYISPLFNFDETTGAVLALVNAALTNNPALDGMAAVAAALEINRMEDGMTGNPNRRDPGQAALSEELAERMRWLLNLPVSATEQDIIAELDKVKAQLGGEGTAATGVDLLALIKAKDTQIAALTAQAGQPDPARFAPVSAVEELTAANAALTARLAELEQQSGTAALSAEIDAAVKDGRVGKHVEGWVRGLAKSNPDQARAYLAQCRPIAALSAMQTANSGTPPAPGGQGTAALTAEERQAARLLDMSEEDYAKAKEIK